MLPRPTPDPFPHLVVDWLWDPGLLGLVRSEIPPLHDHRWRRYDAAHEQGKLEGSDPSMWGPRTRRLIDALLGDAWCAEFSDAFGIPDLVGDTVGGGYHVILPGGRLDAHADFSVHPNRPGLYRRLNCLVYLTDGWQPGHGGELELGDRQVVVEPVFGRTVIFATSATSWHGHPTPWAGPNVRCSVAVYYFAPTPPAGFAGAHSTVWRP